jgi:uncharacterized protein YbcI
MHMHGVIVIHRGGARSQQEHKNNIHYTRTKLCKIYNLQSHTKVTEQHVYTIMLGDVLQSVHMDIIKSAQNRWTYINFPPWNYRACKCLV